MKTRIITVIWFLAAGMWCILGLLFLLWLHRWIFGVAFLASAGLPCLLLSAIAINDSEIRAYANRSDSNKSDTFLACDINNAPRIWLHFG